MHRTDLLHFVFVFGLVFGTCPPIQVGRIEHVLNRAATIPEEKCNEIYAYGLTVYFKNLRIYLYFR